MSKTLKRRFDNEEHEAYIKEHGDIPPDEDYEMDLKESDRKKLWARAGNRCSLCNSLLVLEDSTIIGEECHISSAKPSHRSKKTIRYDPSLKKNELDNYNNAILLCANCHKKIDNSKNTQYTIEELHQIKEKHEENVKTGVKESKEHNESEWIKKEDKKEVRPIKRENEIKHTEDLKKVIKHWIKDIPNVSIDRLQNLSSGILTCYKNGINPLVDYLVLGTFNNHEMKLTIENEIIFEDVLFHLGKQKSDIVKLWTKYKEKCVEQYDIGNELVSEIAKDFLDQIKRETGIEQIIITKYGNETNSISERYLTTIFRACIICAEGDKEEFSKWYEDFESHTGHKDNTIGYSISHLDTGSITIEKGLLEENDLKTKMDSVMIRMFEKAKTDINPKGEKIVNMSEEINNLRNEIKKLLEDQLNYQEFKGKCKYL